MLDITPTKLLIVLVFGLIILGPDKLPRVARQVGEAWSSLKGLRQRMEDEMKGIFPQLPSTTEIASAVRSPISLLDRLAASHETSKAAESAETGTSTDSDSGGGADTDAILGADTSSSTGADADENTTLLTSGNSADTTEDTATTEEPDPAREVVRSVYGLSRSRDRASEPAPQAVDMPAESSGHGYQNRSTYHESVASYIPIPPDDPTFN